MPSVSSASDASCLDLQRGRRPRGSARHCLLQTGPRSLRESQTASRRGLLDTSNWPDSPHTSPAHFPHAPSSLSLFSNACVCVCASFVPIPGLGLGAQDAVRLGGGELASAGRPLGPRRETPRRILPQQLRRGVGCRPYAHGPVRGTNPPSVVVKVASFVTPRCDCAALRCAGRTKAHTAPGEH